MRAGETGFVVGGRDRAALVERVSELLADPQRAAAMGAAGREWVEQFWGWERSAERLRILLDGRDPDSGPQPGTG